MPRPLPATIAIDGPAASGKTTVGQAIARAFGYAFLDTGLMYRAVTLAALRAGAEATAEAMRRFLPALDMRVEVSGEDTEVYIDGERVTARLRDPDVEANVSRYSAIPEVREAMVRRQREIARRGRSILAGRDIGTVVLPTAPLKLYLDASEDARARRRGEQATQPAEDARKDIASRDTIDSTRKLNPLRPAEDAIVIDTTEMSLEQVISLALEKVQCASD